MPSFLEFLTSKKTNNETFFYSSTPSRPSDALIQRTEKNEDVLEMYKAHFVKLNKVAETAQSHARAMTLERNKAQGGAAEASKQRLAIQAQVRCLFPFESQLFPARVLLSPALICFLSSCSLKNSSVSGP